MTCIGESLACNQPSLLNSEFLLIYQDPHQLYYSYSWMCIIKLNSYLIGKVIKGILTILLEPTHNVLDGSSAEKVLLLHQIFLHLQRVLISPVVQ